MDRREFLRSSVVATAAFATFGSSFWRSVFASHPTFAPGPSPYGPLGAPDANGIRLPEGFASRVVARSGELVGGSAYLWHDAPDGGATFATSDGGWIYVSNSEMATYRGGVGALRFGADGAVLDAYPICVATSRNCGGGSTPWGTWLTCEEVGNGLVWECDPAGVRPAIPRPLLGAFNHEAAAIDPTTNQVYLTEDETDGRFYRFTPDGTARVEGVLETGVLEVAKVVGGAVTWLPVPSPIPPPVAGVPTRRQVVASTRFSGGEGIWFDAPARTIYFVTKGDSTIWTYDVDAQRIEILFTSTGAPTSPMNGVDNICLSSSHDLYVCEDHNSSTKLEMIIVAFDERVVAPFCEFVEPLHHDSELTGVAFDPSGSRMYLSSQRANTRGVTYEIAGPFRS